MRHLILAAALLLGTPALADTTLRPLIVEDLPKVTTPVAAPVAALVAASVAEKTFSQRHPVVSKAAHYSVQPVLFPFKLFGKTKVGKAFYKEVSLTEKDLFAKVAEVDDHVSPYSSVIGVIGSGLSILNSVKVLSLH